MPSAPNGDGLTDEGQGSVSVLVASAEEPGFPIIDASPSFTALSGYDPGEVIGQSCRMLQGPATAPEPSPR